MTPVKKQTPKRPLFIIVATVLLNSIGFGIIMPVMPKLVMEVTKLAQGLAGVYWEEGQYFAALESRC